MTDSPKNIDAYAIRAVHSILNGKEAHESDMQVLTGDVRACLDAMQDALREDGVQAARKVFSTLVRDNRPWLGHLASMQPPDMQAEEPARPKRFLTDRELMARPPREWLIPAILPKEGIALLFGPPGCGKSFLAMAWSLCIASGQPWLGREVAHGPVAYIAGEGSFGVGARLQAWKHFYQQDMEAESGVQWFEDEVTLQHAGSFGEFVVACIQAFEQPPVLVVIDTLSRCSGGADENSNGEMAKIISAADMLQRRFHCTVLIVHHCGKDSERGPRGASALIGNTETIIEVARTDSGCRVTCYKQKDAAKFTPFSLKFKLVQYGPGKDDCSAVLIHDACEAQPSLSATESVMLAALTNAGKELTFTEWKTAGVEAGIKERAAERAISNLVKGGHVSKNLKHYSLASKKADGDNNENKLEESKEQRDEFEDGDSFEYDDPGEDEELEYRDEFEDGDSFEYDDPGEYEEFEDADAFDEDD